jgi:hypothetical protein
VSAYTYADLAAGAEALRAAAVKTACYQAAIPPHPADQSGQQKQDVAAIESSFSGVPAMFYPFENMPRPETFVSSLEDLRQCTQFLQVTQNSPDPGGGLRGPQNTSFSLINTVGDGLASWSGAAAREFKANYLDKLPMHIAGQFNAIVTCAKLFEQEQGIWRQAQHDITELLNRSLDVMNDLPHRCSKNSWTITLTVIAAVATIAAPPLGVVGVGLAVETGLALTDGMASIGASLLPDDPPKHVGFSASTAEGVIKEVRRGITEIIDRIVQQEAKIAQVFAASDAVVTQQRTEFVPKRPMLAGVTKANVTDQDFMGPTS